MCVIAETDRLVLSELTGRDAAFVRRLVTDPDWLRFIGDRGVQTLRDARAYIRDGPTAMIRAHGVGLYRVGLRGSGTPVGLCGLLRRDGLADVDLGFALLPEHRGVGYAREAAAAVLAHARDLGHVRVAALVMPANAASVRVLASLGFARDGVHRLGDETLDLYVRDGPAAP